MKIYIYEYTDTYGKQHYQIVEITEEEATNLIHIDYERRLLKANVGDIIEKRTVQQIQDEIDREFINRDRNEYNHRINKQISLDNEGNEIDTMDLICLDDNTPLNNYEKELTIKEQQEKIKKALGILTEKQKRRVIMRYVDEMTLQEIAEVENCDYTSVKESIESAIKKIKKFFKNTP